MARKPKVYEGNEPYIFISYAHKDSDRVLPIIAALQQRGFRVWYDEGLEVGSSWGDMIEEYLYNCECAICFLSPNFLLSQNCKDEIDYAKETEKGPLIVYLDQMEPDRKFRFRYGRLHALKLSDFSNMDAFLDKLRCADVLQPCLGDISRTAPAAKPFAKQSNLVTETPQLNTPTPEEFYQTGVEYYGEARYEEAVVWFRKAAEQGNALAQYQIGNCFKNGIGVSKDIEEAAIWYKKAALQGNAAAQKILEECDELLLLTLDEFIQKALSANSMDEKIRWYRIAAERGHAGAAYTLARALEYHVKNPEEADRWYRIAAERGHRDAVLLWADKCKSQHCYKEAIIWYQKAVKMKHPFSKAAEQSLQECSAKLKL